MKKIFDLMDENIKILDNLIKKRPAKTGTIKMEVTGIVLRKLELETGTSKAGKEWKKQSIVIDTGGDFNNEVCISAFGDKLKQMHKLEIGMDVSVLCNVYSREYNGRYFHNIDGYFFTDQSNKSSDKITNGESEEDMPF